MLILYKTEAIAEMDLFRRPLYKKKQLIRQFLDRKEMLEDTCDSCNGSLQTVPLKTTVIRQFLYRKGMLEDTGDICNGSLLTAPL
jgi:hypothetical protein